MEDETPVDSGCPAARFPGTHAPTSRGHDKERKPFRPFQNNTNSLATAPKSITSVNCRPVGLRKSQVARGESTKLPCTFREGLLAHRLATRPAELSGWSAHGDDGHREDFRRETREPLHLGGPLRGHGGQCRSQAKGLAASSRFGNSGIDRVAS